jgi:biopolymer transport protein ExbB/TolQ
MRELLEIWRQGGAVMPPLALCHVALWWAIGERAWTLRGRPADVLELDRHSGLIRTLATVAPLLGLLGTVGGMIETFDALATMTLFRSSGGVAGGISEALVSTQVGLVVALPGLIAGRLLDRRADRLRGAS